MKHCPHCTQVKPFEAFYASSTHKSGYASWCKECETDRNKAKYEQRKEAYAVKAKEWRDANKASQAIRVKAWREANPEQTKHIYRDWAQRNKDKVNAKWMQRDASKKCRTPAWLIESDWLQIQCKYQLAAMYNREGLERWDVDHIVPLQGRKVSGLHVPSNLRVIKSDENKRKANKYVVA